MVRGGGRLTVERSGGSIGLQAVLLWISSHTYSHIAKTCRSLLAARVRVCTCLSLRIGLEMNWHLQGVLWPEPIREKNMLQPSVAKS